MDITDGVTRSRMMANIRSKNTFPELCVRSALHARGFRFRLHDKALPGKPDIVLPKWKAAVFIHGCFWHLHGCANSKIPSTRQEFWSQKLSSNAERDRQQINALQTEGWRVAVVWECSIRRAIKTGNLEPYEKLSNWLRDEVSTSIEI